MQLSLDNTFHNEMERYNKHPNLGKKAHTFSNPDLFASEHFGKHRTWLTSNNPQKKALGTEIRSVSYGPDWKEGAPEPDISTQLKNLRDFHGEVHKLQFNRPEKTSDGWYKISKAFTLGKPEKAAHVSSVAVMHDGKMLFGKRRDNGKFTMPGGHAEGNETPEETAKRELEEETGIKAKSLIKLGSGRVINEEGKLIEVHSFLLNQQSPTSTLEDPDGEIQGRWIYRDVKDGLPEDIANNLHAPKNITLKLLDLQDWKDTMPDNSMKPIEKAHNKDQVGLFGSVPIKVGKEKVNLINTQLKTTPPPETKKVMPLPNSSDSVKNIAERRNSKEKIDKLHPYHRDLYTTLKTKSDRGNISDKDKGALDHFHNYIGGGIEKTHLVDHLEASHPAPKEITSMLKAEEQFGLFEMPKKKSPIEGVPTDQLPGHTEDKAVDLFGNQVGESFGAHDNKVSAKDGKYVFNGGGQGNKEFAEALHGYTTHSNFIHNAKPEHQNYREQILQLHNSPSEIRNHFNNTVGRYQHIDKKPIKPTDRDTLMDHDPEKLTGSHWEVRDLPDEHKREMDEFHSGKEFDRAVREGDISPGLSKYLKKYKADHLNAEEDNPDKKREWAMHRTDEGGKSEWTPSEKGAKTPLERFWEHPVSSNREPVEDEKVKQRDADLDKVENFSNMSERELQRIRKIKEQPDYSHTESNNMFENDDNYQEGSTVDYAGQSHKVGKVHDKVVTLEGEDGIKRVVKKDDIANIKHITPELGDVIHKNKFKDQLRGREFREDDYPATGSYKDMFDEMPEDIAKRLHSLGFSHEEARDIHHYINSPKPRKDRIDTGKKAKKNLERQDLAYKLDNNMDASSTPTKTEDSIGEKIYQENLKNHEIAKRKYEGIINKHADKLKKEFHAGKNSEYMSGMIDPKGRKDDLHPLHVINEAGIKHALKDVKSAEDYVYPQDIARSLGIEYNDYVRGEIENRFREMAKKGKIGLDVKGNKNLVARIAKAFSHGFNYFTKSLKTFILPMKLIKNPQPTDELKAFVKSLDVADIWELHNTTQAEIEEYTRLMLNRVTDSNEGRYEHYKKALHNKAMLHGVCKIVKADLIEELGMERIEKALPTPYITCNGEGDFMLGFDEPLIK